MAYLTLLRERPAFRRLWWGDVVSLLGDWFNMIAVYTAVQALSGSAQALAAVFAAKTVPSMLIAPVAGPIVDRFDRRRLLVLLDLVRLVGVAVLILAFRADSLTGIYLALVVMAMASGVAAPARSAALPLLVKAPELGIANALEGATWSVMLAVGAAAGGVATDLLGVEAALVLDGLSYAASAVIFFNLPRLPPAAREGDDRRFIAGLRYLMSHREVLRIAALKPMMAIAGGAIVLIPVLGKASPAIVGLLFMARGLGAFVGSILPQKNVGFGFAGYAIGFLLVALSDGFAGQAAGFLVAGAGSGVIWVQSSTLLMDRAAPEFHGRVFAAEFGVMTTVSAMAAWLVTAGLDAGLGPQLAAGLVGAAMLLPVLVRRRDFRWPVAG